VHYSLDRVACGRDFAMVISSAGHVYTWGNGEYGQLGHQENKIRKIPKKISALREMEIPAVLGINIPIILFDLPTLCKNSKEKCMLFLYSCLWW